MKKFIYLMAIVLLSSCVAPKAGFTSVKLCQQNYMGDGWDSYDESGFYAGLEFDELDIGLDKIKLQPSILYIGGVSDLSQIQVPIQFNYGFAGDNFGVKAGPSASFLTNAPMNYKSISFGVDTGVYYKINDNFKLESDYSFGLSNVSDTSIDRKINNFRIGFAYKF